MEVRGGTGPPAPNSRPRAGEGCSTRAESFFAHARKGFGKDRPMRTDDNLIRVRVRDDTPIVSHGESVLVTRRDGWIEGGIDEGLFVQRTRLLSRYRCFLGRHRPTPVTLTNVRQDHWIGCYLVAAPGSDGGATDGTPQHMAQQGVELRVTRTVGEGMHEDLDVTNWSREPVALRLSLEFEADFADPEEAKGERRQRGRTRRQWREDDDGWTLRTDYRVRHHYRHQGNRGVAALQRALSLHICDAATPPIRRGKRISFDIALAPQQGWHACLDWIAEIDGEVQPLPRCVRATSAGARRDARERVSPGFLDDATDFASAETGTLAPVVLGALAQARRDLAALRLPRHDHEDGWTFAAGVPMFVSLFGRDTLLAAGEAALIGPEPMRGTLRELAQWQGRRHDDWRDEQPGRVLHEAQTGPLAQLRYHPKGRYQRSPSSSILYPLVVAQLWSWTGDLKVVGRLVEPALKALAWLEREATDARGFHACATRSRQGLKNQTWKDSDDSLLYADGSQVGQPAATCEEQGMAYAARLAFAEVLRAFGKRDQAARLVRAAQALRQRFNDAYWCEEIGSFALALDPDGRQVASVGSNAMHCVATGIADEALARRVLERMFARDMFSGWGIRTLSAAHPAYSPYAYHRGAVWPVEHGPFAVAAYRLGEHARMEQLCRAQFEAAALFDYRRLPECFSGHAREHATPFPAIYPAANAPQAWSATTVFTLVQALLGLRAFAPARTLMLDPHLPEWLPELTLHRLRVGSARVDLRFRRGADGITRFEVLDQRGRLHIARRAIGYGEEAGMLAA
jgi:glycogen debranching enzyme